MDIEEKIINEIRQFLPETVELDKNKIETINELIVNQSVEVANQEKEIKVAISYIENKLHDLFT